MFAGTNSSYFAILTAYVVLSGLFGLLTAAEPVGGVAAAAGTTGLAVLIWLQKRQAEFARVRLVTPLAGAFAVGGMWLYLTGGLAFLAQDADIGANTDGSPLNRLLYVSVYAGAAGWLIFSRSRPSIVRRNLIPLLIVSLMPVLSIAWSHDPLISAEKSIAFVGTSLFAFWFAWQFRWTDQVSLLLTLFFLVSLGSLGVIVGAPDIGIGDDGNWKGLFVHKNNLGRFASLSAGFSLITILHSVQRRNLAFLTLLCSLILLGFADSMTALLTFAVFIVSIALFAITRLPRVLSVPLFALSGVTILFLLIRIIDLSEEFLIALDRDPTLTGRTDLWTKVVEATQLRPITGFGYGAFWRGPDGPSIEIWHMFNWGPNSAHMGYLDVALQFGYVGLGVFVVIALGLIIQAFVQCWRTKGFEVYWAFAYLVFFLVSNLTESFILSQNSFYWILFVVAALNLGRAKVDRTVVGNESLANSQ